jgi:hypothetical protein
MITRGMNPSGPGLVHWSIGPLVDNDSLQTELLTKTYQKKALVPELTWLKHNSTEIPDIDFEFSEDEVSVTINNAEKEISNWVVYYKYDERWSEKVLSKKQKVFTLPYTVEIPDDDLDSLSIPKILFLQEVQVTLIDRFGSESSPTVRLLNK